MDQEMQHSKTFTWDKVTLSVPFVQELMEHSVIYIWHDETVRVTVAGKNTKMIDDIAAKHNGIPAKGDKGQWIESWR